MGFDITKIKYDSVRYVHNWMNVSILNKDNKLGIVSACTGDTILPCIFDSINYKNHYCFLSSTKLHHKKDTTDFKGLYKYHSDSEISSFSCLFFDDAEQAIFDFKNTNPIDTTLQDSIKVYAARTYYEVRNANLHFLKSGVMYSLLDIPSLDSLISLQNKELAITLNRLNRTIVLTKITNIISSNIIEPINSSMTVSFNKAFAKSFYLCFLKERILERDSVNLFSLTQEFLSLFYNEYSIYKLMLGTNINIKADTFNKSYHSFFLLSELRDNNLDSWYNYINMLLYMDMSANVQHYINKRNEHYADILENMQLVHDDFKRKSEENIQRMKNIIKKGINASDKEIADAIKLYDENIKLVKDVKILVNGQLDYIGTEKYQIGNALKKLINDVFSTLSNVVINSQNIYNAEFLDICEQLYLITVFRQYEISSLYQQYLEKMDKAKHPIYMEFKKQLDLEDKMLETVKDYREKNNDN